MKKFSLNFKTTCTLVGVLFVFLSLSLFMKGLMRSMAEFKVPESILNSPHYYDALFWVYVHMISLGILIVLLGVSVTDTGKQKWITLILFGITAFYAYLDFRSSDSILGNGLYRGESSLAPAIIGLFVNLLFLQLAVKLFRADTGNRE